MKILKDSQLTLTISAKCSDLFTANLTQNDELLKEYQGYVPDIVPNTWGDYVDLVIDVRTGKILNWIVPTETQLEEFIESQNS